MQHIPLMTCLSKMCPLLTHIMPQGAQYPYKPGDIPAQGDFPVKDGLITVYYNFLETDDLEKLKSTVNNWYKAGKTVAVLPSKAPGASHSLLIEIIHYGFSSSHSNFSQELDFVLGLGI